MATSIPNSIILQRHPDIPDRFSLAVHLRTEFSTGRQYNTEFVELPRVEIWLRQWAASPARFMEQHFGWRAAEVDARIRAHGNREGRPQNPAVRSLTLADLGL